MRIDSADITRAFTAMGASGTALKLIYIKCHEIRILFYVILCTNRLVRFDNEWVRT